MLDLAVNLYYQSVDDNSTKRKKRSKEEDEILLYGAINKVNWIGSCQPRFFILTKNGQFRRYSDSSLNEYKGSAMIEEDNNVKIVNNQLVFYT